MVYSLMKINEKIAKDSIVKSRSEPQKSHFQSMLDRHVHALRNDSQKKSQNNNTPTDEHSVESRESKELTRNIAKLENSSPEYFAKGMSKQTLAATFTKRFGARVEDRIEKFKPLIKAKAEKHGLDPNLLAALVKQESNFNPYAVSSCGALGLGQLMPETAKSLGVTDPFNAAQNLDAAACYLKKMLDRFGGNTDKALAAYNAGPGAVQKFGGIPPYQETQHYVRAIHGHKAFMVKNEIFNPLPNKKV